MNIDNVYVCDIYRLEDRIFNKFDIKESSEDNIFYYINGNYINKCVFVKKALVYYSIIQGGFVDMETGNFYRFGYSKQVGELFVDVHKSKIYGKDLMKTKKKFYSKKKIIKRYDEYKGCVSDKC